MCVDQSQCISWAVYIIWVAIGPCSALYVLTQETGMLLRGSRKGQNCSNLTMKLLTNLQKIQAACWKHSISHGIASINRSIKILQNKFLICMIRLYTRLYQPSQYYIPLPGGTKYPPILQHNLMYFVSLTHTSMPIKYYNLVIFSLLAQYLYFL